MTLAYLHIPILFVFLYAFTTEEASFKFPPPSLTTRWFGLAAQNAEIRAAVSLSLRVALISMIIALILGTLVAAAVWRTPFFGRDTLSLFIILPIALPGIITGIALRSAINLGDFPFSYWTVVIGHATFCVAVVYNNVIARMRRTSPSMLEASMDLGATGLANVPARAASPCSPRRWWSAGCSPSPSPSTRSSSRHSPPGISRPSRSGSSPRWFAPGTAP